MTHERKYLINLVDFQSLSNYHQGNSVFLFVRVGYYRTIHMYDSPTYIIHLLDCRMKTFTLSLYKRMIKKTYYVLSKRMTPATLIYMIAIDYILLITFEQKLLLGTAAQ
jgi:hypothetical protein